MNDDDFAPGGMVPLFRSLATVYLRRKDLAALASELSGGDLIEASASLAQGALPLWGLVYAHEDSIGFYAHPETSQFSSFLERGADASRAIDLRVPASCVVAAELEGEPAARTALGRLFRLVSGDRPRAFRLEWAVRGETRRLVFRIEGGARDLESHLSRYYPKRD